MATYEPTRFAQELGKAICDRLGLDQGSTARDWTAKSAGKTVLVTMTTMKVMPVDEYNELLAVAAARAERGGQ